MKRILRFSVLALAFIAFTTPAWGCKLGETRFNWKTMKEERCDDRLADQYSRYPWQDDWETCTWVDFPDDEKTDGDEVCGNAGAGECKAVVREDILRANPPSSDAYKFLEYNCSENLSFAPSEKVCGKDPDWELLLGKDANVPERCIQIKTRASCCK